MRFTPPLRFTAALALALLLAPPACRRKPASAPAADLDATPAAPKPPAGSIAPAPEPPDSIQDSLPTAPPDASLRFPVNKELTGAIHLYLTDYRKLPPDFATLVKAKYLKAMPQAPPGKRFALDRNRMQVVLLD